MLCVCCEYVVCVFDARLYVVLCVCVMFCVYTVCGVCVCIVFTVCVVCNQHRVQESVQRHSFEGNDTTILVQ